MIKKSVLALGVACLLAFSVSEASAQCNCLQQGITYGNRVFAPRPPYFAMHPPVYYDRVVPRAYGMSPFAVPPGVMPVENTVALPPKSVTNPYFKGEKVIKAKTKEAKAAPTGKTAQKTRARRVSNPFYLAKVVQAG